MIYLDTSILAALYLPEALSERAERVVRSEAAPAISELTSVELFSVVARKVRERALSRVDAGRVTATFLSHVAEGFYTQLALERTHYLLARDWLGRFAVPLRSLDALHLAVASQAGARLATADGALARAAGALGVARLLIRIH